MKIAIGNDHAAVALKNHVMETLQNKGIEVVNFGTDTNASCHYPVFAAKVAKAVASKECDLGILICSTGIGISIAANKVHGIRCAHCADPFSAMMTRRHNDANILAFGADIVGAKLADAMVEAFLNAEFEGGRHQTRVDLITALEQNQTLD